jgi:hypothetical protein
VDEGNKPQRLTRSAILPMRSAGGSTAAMGQPCPAPRRNEKERAESFLRTMLAGGPRKTRDVEDEARHGHQITHRTLVRARKDLRIPARKIGADWYIALSEQEGDLKDFKPPEPGSDLPAKSANSAKSSSPGLVGTLGTLPSEYRPSEKNRKAS